MSNCVELGCALASRAEENGDGGQAGAMQQNSAPKRGHIGKPDGYFPHFVQVGMQHGGRIPGARYQGVRVGAGNVKTDLALAKEKALGFEIQRKNGLRPALRQPHQLFYLSRTECHGRQAHHDAIAGEDGGKRFTHDRVDAETVEGLRGMLSRGAAAKIPVDKKDRSALVLWIIEGMGPGLSRGIESLVEKRILAHAREGDLLQIARRNDSVRVDIVASDRNGPSSYLHYLCICTHLRYSRTSTILPVKAAAATIAGLMRMVRPPGLPCRPIKFRLEEEAQISLPCSLSGFIARHIEQPASLHSKPACVKMRSNPSFSAKALTAAEPGTTSARTPDRTLLPLAIRAAARRSLRREFVQEPIKATSTGVPKMGFPGCQPMCS